MVTMLLVANGFVIQGTCKIPSNARCASTTVTASTRTASSPARETACNRLDSSLCAHKRRSGDDDDEMTYDDAYIDELINEKFDDFDDDYDDDFLDGDIAESRSDEKEYARVGRRSVDDVGRDDDGGTSRMDADRSSSSSSQSSSSSSGRRRRTITADLYDDDVLDEEDDNFYDEEDYNEDDDDLFEEGILIPNPILDAVDPEGAADRIGELFMDPKWWRDAAAIAAVVVAVYLYTVDPTDLIPWDSVTADDFNLRAMYER